jgi:murein DD-endopeptidase MepM/ murein hydrolase activator NlpD
VSIVLKKFTILVIPEGTHSVKRFSFHGLILPLLFLTVLCSLGLGGYWYYQYRSIQSNLPNLQALQTQNQRQEAQINAFARGLTGLKEQVTKLKAFNQRLRAMANIDKKGGPEPLAGVGGPESAVSGPGVRLSSSMHERQISTMQRDMAQLTAEAEAEQALQEELAKFLNERRSILASTPSLWPVRGWVTSGFGFRTSPWTGKRHFHSGIDISTRVGTPIVAPADGIVTFADFEGAYGRMLVVNHGHGLVTRYGHLHAFKVKVGQKIKRGQVIAQVGSTGRSTGSHLHYEVLLAGVPANPRYYILH